NYVQAQAVDASQPFDLQWQKVSRRGAGDSLALTVYGPDGKQLISQSNISFDQTNLTIAPGTLQPNTTNRSYFTLAHFFGSSKPHLAPRSFALERKITRFNIKTLNP